jgi:hypothetical protein
VESAELRGLRTWLEAPEHLSAVRSVVGWDQSDGCSEVARAAPRTRGELLLAAASAAGPEGDDGVVRSSRTCASEGSDPEVDHTHR